MIKTLVLMMGLFFVATFGNGSAADTRPDVYQVAPSGELTTPAQAVEAIRQARAQGKAADHAVIAIADGVYYLDKPIELGPQDSSITFSGQGNAIISGGKVIEGFRQVEADGKKMIMADLPEVREGKWKFTQLFVNGRRAMRPRLPREGYYQVVERIDPPEGEYWQKGEKKFRFNPGEIDPDWRNLQDVEILAFHFWIESRMPIKSVDGSNNIVELQIPATFRLTEDFDPNRGARYWVENVFEAIRPGEWYLDRRAMMTRATTA